MLRAKKTALHLKAVLQRS